MLFPSLFPFGLGDRYGEGGSWVAVNLHSSNQHLLRYAQTDSATGKLITPHASHLRWPHWAQNTCERHRQVSQRRVFVEKDSEVSRMDAEEFLDIARGNNQHRLRELVGRMSAYQANINGSDA